MSAELTAGMKLDVYVPPSVKGGETVKLASSLEGFSGSTKLLITAPTLGTTKYPVDVGQEVNLQCFIQNAIISFDGVVAQRLSKGDLSYLLLERMGDFRRTQRRQDFRLECLLDGRLEYTDPESGNKKKILVIISDISGGGTSVLSERRFNIGDEVTVHMPIGEKLTNITFFCDVRRCYENKDSVLPMRYNVGLRFLFKDEKEKDYLISRVFVMERARLKSSLHDA